MSTASRLRLTTAGTGVLVGSMALVVVGLVTGYREFLVLALVGAIAMLLALFVPRLMSPVSFRRVNPPRFAARGEVVQFSVEASAERATTPLRMIDQVGNLAVAFAVPPVTAGSPETVTYRIQARRRGVHKVGPLREERHDPFALTARTVDHGLHDELLVHPIIHRLRLPEGSTRQRHAQAIMPRFSEDPLADFRSLREYVAGDDRRLVHWPSTAKTGKLMVRDHFDLRRTTRTVVLETLSSTITSALFEEAVEIAASLVCESLTQGVAVIARTRDHRFPGSARPVRHRQEALELFARVQQTNPVDTVSAAQLRIMGEPSDQVYLVASATSPLVRQMVTHPTIGPHLVVVRVEDGTTSHKGMAVRGLRVATSEQFAARCRQGLVAGL